MQLHHIFLNAPLGITYYVTCNLVYFVHENCRSVYSSICTISREKREWRSVERAYRARGRIQPPRLLGFSKNDELSKKRDRFVTRIIAPLHLFHSNASSFSISLYCRQQSFHSVRLVGAHVARSLHRRSLSSFNFYVMHQRQILGHPPQLLDSAVVAFSAARPVRLLVRLFTPNGPAGLPACHSNNGTHQGLTTRFFIAGISRTDPQWRSLKNCIFCQLIRYIREILLSEHAF